MQTLSQTQEPAKRLPLLIDLSAAQIDQAPEQTVLNAEQAIALAQQLNETQMLADASLNLGRGLLKLERFDRAEAAAQRACDIYGSLKLVDRQIEALFTLANIAFSRGDYQTALTQSQAALTLIDPLAKPAEAATILELMAASSMMTGRFDEAAGFQNQAIEFRQKVGDGSKIALARVTLGSIEQARGKPDVAVSDYREALGFFENKGDENNVAIVSFYLGMVAFDRKDDYEAERNLTRAIELFKMQNNRVFLPAALRGLGWLRQRQAREPEAAALLAEAELDPAATRKWAEAEQRLTSELKARDVEKLEQERKIQQLTVERQRIIIVAASLGAALMAALGIVAFNAYRLKRRSARQLEAKNKDLAEANRVITNERARSETLLLSILPPMIATQLKQSPGIIADDYPSATILFADIVGFTPLSRTVAAAELVRLLDQIFSRFDMLAARHRLEKIKTIGDCYMAVGGLPEPQSDHCERIALMALDVLEEIAAFNRTERIQVNVRIGIHSGPVVAGVIGRHKFSYDLWGDTVNTASRLESTGLSGQIHVSEEVARALKDKFDFEPRGLTEVKGVGLLPTYFLNRA